MQTIVFLSYLKYVYLKAELIALTEEYLMYVIHVTTTTLKGGGKGVYFMVSFLYYA